MNKKSDRLISLLVRTIVLLVIAILALATVIFIMKINREQASDMGTENKVVIPLAETEQQNPVLNFPGPEMKEGDALFKQHCRTCHAFSKQLTGPALEGIEKRVPAPADVWLRNYIRNSDKLVESKDAYAVSLRENSATKYTHRFDFLTAQQINSILMYITNRGGCI